MTHPYATGLMKAESTQWVWKPDITRGKNSQSCCFFTSLCSRRFSHLIRAAACCVFILWKLCDSCRFPALMLQPSLPLSHAVTNPSHSFLIYPQSLWFLTYWKCIRLMGHSPSLLLTSLNDFKFISPYWISINGLDKAEPANTVYLPQWELLLTLLLEALLALFKRQFI